MGNDILVKDMKISIHSICPIDYYTGSDAPMKISVPVQAGMTPREFIEAAESEFYSVSASQMEFQMFRVVMREMFMMSGLAKIDQPMPLLCGVEGDDFCVHLNVYPAA
tara:strand:- start:271 stop:594 length:324 start_codon:yes stop_codon:yes gene_type:complete